MEKIVFLPGASGNIEFWNPLIDFLPRHYEKEVIGYPGFGNVPDNTNIKNFRDLQNDVTSKINSKSILIAQSMGGIFAVNKAFTDPSLIKGLVLIATSGGIDLTPFNVQDWRTEYQEQYPRYPKWFMTTNVNYEEYLEKINIPTLLIWGDDDPISPINVGKYLNTILKDSKLKIIKDGKHDLAEKHAKEVSLYINQFLETIP
ncbi:alpha/beta hydrolase [Acinetobacter sp. ANC 5380]|uniref:Alpha/beta hydrolase n=1 Tax=Acinetobacter terrae TaxID=2731247 RepID=A0A7Y2RHE1_9GAMM|nr:alpha/beta hydrolase [Acinetobacter terrae]NNH78857.1 alpha/beta hydrolase [Acinetobacter terrae]